MRFKGGKAGCKDNGIDFSAIVLYRVSTKAHFQFQFWQFECVAMSARLFLTMLRFNLNIHVLYKIGV